MLLFLQEIEIFNFKSFRGNCNLTFPKPFTAIIGTNGAGKSNYMDAISFVIGERTSNLRVRRLSDLIYGAHIGKPIERRAYVKAILSLENDVIKSFTRAILDSSCEYKIDQEIVTADFYLSELAKLGINVKASNFLIFQERIESVVLQTPKERAQMFDEISQSNTLKTEYERLKIGLEKYKEEVLYLTNKKKELLGAIKNAKLQESEAERFESLEKKRLRVKSKFSLFELFHIKRAIEDEETALNNKALQIDEYKNDEVSARELLKRKKSKVSELTKNLESIEQNLAVMEKDFRKKETIFLMTEEQVDYWQKKVDSAKASLAGERKSNDTHKKTIQELKDEMKVIDELRISFEQNMSTQYISQESGLEFNNEQVKQYLSLKEVATKESASDLQRIDSLKREKGKYENNVDNEKRKKADLQNELHKKKILMEETKKQFLKLEEYTQKTETALSKSIAAKQDLDEKISTYKERVESIEKDVRLICEELDDVKTDNYTAARLKKQANTIKCLKSSFRNVYGRLSDLCKPIHQRYNVAVTKIFGRHMNSIVVGSTVEGKKCIQYLKDNEIGVETFLPLDNLKCAPLKESIRDIQSPKNVKLLYDVLQFSPEINSAILFVTNNILVCETPEDARILAYETKKNQFYDCIALDGTFFKKSGIISGGESELLKKSKAWKQKHLEELKSKKEILMERLKETIKNPPTESDVDILNNEIQGLRKRLQYSKISLDNTTKRMSTLRAEVDEIEKKLITVCDNVTKIEASMEEINNNIRQIQKRIENVEDNIFESFCKNIGLMNIRQYENRDLRIHQEQTQRIMELNEQFDRIKNLLDYELQRDTQSAISKLESSLETAKQKLQEANKKSILRKGKIDSVKCKLNELRATCKAAKLEMTAQEKNCIECRHQIDVIAKLLRDSEKEIIIILTNIKKLKDQWKTILQNCKVECIEIPFLAAHSIESNESSINTEKNLYSRDMLSCIDFHLLSEKEQSSKIQIVKQIRDDLSSKINEIENAIKAISNPNFKAAELVISMKMQLKEIDAVFRVARNNAKTLEKEFSKIKYERCKIFMECIERVNGELDTTYKSLVQNTSAQAFLTSDNPEEPFAGGINYCCIPPKKRFQMLANFSGGEKTLAALALVFAIQHYKPAPFFVMDEMDAALDNRNLKNLVSFIRSKLKETQLIIISLNEKLQKHADALVGITSVVAEECMMSQMFTLSLDDYPTNI